MRNLGGEEVIFFEDRPASANNGQSRIGRIARGATGKKASETRDLRTGTGWRGLTGRHRTEEGVDEAWTAVAGSRRRQHEEENKEKGCRERREAEVEG